MRLSLVATAVAALALAVAAAAGTGTQTVRLKWPAHALQTATYARTLKVAGHVKSVTLKYKGLAVPRGFAGSNIVDCAHNGPAFLNWSWTASGSSLRLRVKLTTGACSPGPTVAGKSASLVVTVTTG
jgi:hypothetical protein